MVDKDTQKHILDAAEKEFMEHGFLKASLRTIVKNAGVTTGAFYGYYNSKEELFDELVSPHEEYMLSLFMNAINQFEAMDAESQTHDMGRFSRNCWNQMVDYAYEHKDSVKLLVCCSEGTRHADFIHKMVVREEKATSRYLDTLKKAGEEIPAIDQRFTHMIASGMFTGFFENIVHDISKEEAERFTSQLMSFYQAGWSYMMKQNFVWEAD